MTAVKPIITVSNLRDALITWIQEDDKIADYEFRYVEKGRLIKTLLMDIDEDDKIIIFRSACETGKVHHCGLTVFDIIYLIDSAHKYDNENEPSPINIDNFIVHHKNFEDILQSTQVERGDRYVILR